MSKLRELANKWPGRIILGGAVATALVGGGIRLAEFDDSGTVIENRTFITEDWYNARISASGGVVEYDALLVQNPLLSLSGATVGTNAGSGLLLIVSYENIKNPNANSLDICYVRAAMTATGSGKGCIMENTCTSTGCIQIAVLTGSVAAGGSSNWAKWVGTDYIKVVQPTRIATYNAGFDARLRFKLHDIAGE